MPRSFDVSVESPVSVEQVHTALGDANYWLGRLARFGGNTTLDSLTVDADQTVRVAMTQDLRHDLLPGVVAKFYHRNLTIRHTEIWKPVDDRELRGEIDVVVTGAPGSGSGAAVVVPVDSGSRLTFTATVLFKVPLVGGGVESFIAREFAKGIPDIQRFTATWIAEHA